MSDRTSCAGTRNVTSSPESVAGASRSASPGGPTTAPSGPGAAPANLSARQAEEAGLLTSGTYGRTGTISSESAALQRSLASRLQARTASLGSTLYKLTWKERTTPAGRPIPALRASARRISAKGNGSVPTICDLPQVGYNTPRATDGKNGGPNQAGGALSHDASLAGWSTASARDWKDTPGMSMMATNPDGSERTRADQLPRQAVLAGWPTAVANDDNKSPEAHLAMKKRMGERDGTGSDRKQITSLAVMAKFTEPCRLTVHGEMLAGWPTPDADTSGSEQTNRGQGTRLKMLGAARQCQNGPARLTVHGEMLTGSSAEMTSGGQLNPEHSRWLMGYPAVWGSCGATAMQSIRGRRKSSSKRTSGRVAKSSTTKPINPFS